MLSMQLNQQCPKEVGLFCTSIISLLQHLVRHRDRLSSQAMNGSIILRIVPNDDTRMLVGCAVTVPSRHLAHNGQSARVCLSGSFAMFYSIGLAGYEGLSRNGRPDNSGGGRHRCQLAVKEAAIPSSDAKLHGCWPYVSLEFPRRILRALQRFRRRRP